jgi:hypothetical protein
MQAFYAREVIKETQLGVPDIISNTVIIKLLSELPDNLEEIKTMSRLP